MERSLERTDARSDGRVGVCLRGAGHAHREGGVISTTMLCMKDQCKIEDLNIQLGIFIAPLHHKQEILRYRAVFIGVTDMQRTPHLIVAQHLIGISDDGGELRNEVHRLPDEVFGRDVIGILIVSVQLQHTSGQDVHDVFSFQ